ncbi:MAG: EAL domain-containing protein [Oscillospiraceae bacterium]|nr:EAL domain-containing protein [Oscillospiraceae bacterium]
MDQHTATQIYIYAPTILTTVTCFIFTVIMGRTDKLQNRLYIMLIGIVGIDAAVNLAGGLTEKYVLSSLGLRIIYESSHYIYFLTHAMLCPLFFYYVACVCGLARIRKYSWFYFLPAVISEIPIILNPVFHSVWYFGEDGLFRRNWAETGIYLAAAFYFVISLGMLLTSWNAINTKRRVALIYFFLIVVTGVVIQLLFKEIRSELYCEAVALMGIMVTTESEEDRINVDTGLSNRKALGMDITRAMMNHSSMSLICVRISNGDQIRKAVGSENMNLISEIVSGFFTSIVPRYQVYNVSSDSFVITILERQEITIMGAAEKISSRFEGIWHHGDADVILKATVMIADVPGRIKSADEAFFMIDNPLPANNEKKILSGDDLDYLMRIAAVEKAVAKGLANGSFEVYYQPTYHCATRKIHGAEALVRLNDPLMGCIFPDEFIPVAERMGLIDEIDDFVLRDVCSFILSGFPQKHGMDCINMNLSMLEVTQPGFVGHVISMVDEYGIDKTMLNFEITESAATSDYNVVNEVITSLKKCGFSFSMDDYGTGYSNIESVFSLDFDVIKIDKSILWSAEKTELGHIILENTVHMIRQMGRKILAEGV